jgi:hypothetical protein
LARRRQPLLYQEFPIVAGADLIDLEGALSGLIRELRSVMGNPEEEEHLVSTSFHRFILQSAEGVLCVTLNYRDVINVRWRKGGCLPLLV